LKHSQYLVVGLIGSEDPADSAF